jgi:L-lactate dehydrogenase complex protein LldE
MSIVPDNRPNSKQVQLMATCLCDAFYDDVACATVEILEHLGCEIEFPDGQTCCGQAGFNAGDWAAARRVIRHTIKVFDGTAPIILPSSSCAAMLFHNATLAFEGEADRGEADALGRRTWELFDYIVNGLGVHSWPGRFDATIALHRSCHTRGTPSADCANTLLKSIKGITLVDFDEGEQCCGFGGTFSVTLPNISSSMGRLKLANIRAAKPDLVASVDTSCLMHMGGLAAKEGNPIRTMHVAQILRDALKQA